MSGSDGRVIASLTFLALTACGGGSEAPELLTAVVRDSAGVTIVENQAPPAGSRMAWQVGAAPAVSIGTLEGAPEYQLYQVVDAMRLDDGTLLVANRGSQEIRAFDATGTYVGAWGREGEGPGEFTGLTYIEPWLGDSVIAYDFRQRRMTVFGHDGELGRTFPLETSEEMALPQFRAVLPGGSLVASAAAVFSTDNMEPGLTRRDQVFALLSNEGEQVGSLGTHPGSEAFVQGNENFVSVMSHPYARFSAFAVWGELLLISTNDTYELKAYDQNGALARIVRRDHTLRAPTQSELDAFIERTIAELPEESRVSRRQMYDGMPLVDHYPAYSTVLVDGLGYLWVAEYTPRGEESGPTVWTVFDPEGRIEGFVETPENLSVNEIGEDYVLGTTEDDFDVEYVQLYSLTRPTT